MMEMMKMTEGVLGYDEDSGRADENGKGDQEQSKKANSVKAIFRQRG